MSTCRICGHPSCDCAARLAAVITHTRTATDQGPDYCADCSQAVSEWVQWPCPSSKPPACNCNAGRHYRKGAGPDPAHCPIHGTHPRRTDPTPRRDPAERG